MEIKVNDQEWKGVSSEDQKNINNIMSSYFKGGKITPDAATPPSPGVAKGLIPNPFCKPACDIAEAAAVAACAGLSGPAAAVCVAAAHIAGDACRNGC